MIDQILLTEKNDFDLPEDYSNEIDESQIKKEEDDQDYISNTNHNSEKVGLFQIRQDDLA